jgi:ATP-dependent RNA helicase DeaD
MQTTETCGFESFGLKQPILRAIQEMGYQTPTEIQMASLPKLLAGGDVLGQAQTGTGKTAAFGLSFLSQIDVDDCSPQLLILTPTRELAIQVADALKDYAKYLNNCHILPIYGGQNYATQLKALRQGVQIVVGTPGRVIDHIQRGTLKLGSLRFLVLDEADEMLKMGFIDDVEIILEQVPETRQTALFSATMPPRIKNIADQYLRDATHIKIMDKKDSVENIRQRFCVVKGENKMMAVTRLLEAEAHEGVIIFASTKMMTMELADKIRAAGYPCEALNGDIPQNKREIVINRFKQGRFDILVATDVAARGLDVDRVTHVINYDLPMNTEVYVHRIGRTGRAGRTGDAILLVRPSEVRYVQMFERMTRKSIEKMELPTMRDLCEIRKTKFLAKIQENLTTEAEDLAAYQNMLSSFQVESTLPWERIAASLAVMAVGKKSIWAKDEPMEREFAPKRDAFSGSRARLTDSPRGERFDRDSFRGERSERRLERASGERSATRRMSGDRDRSGPGRFSDRDDAFSERFSAGRSFSERSDRPRSRRAVDADMTAFEIKVGREHGASPRHIVGAIANEAGINSSHIGNITLHDTYTTLYLSKEVAAQVEDSLSSAYLFGQRLRLCKPSEKAGNYSDRSERVYDRPAEKFKPRSKTTFKSKRKEAE